ncbi:NADH-quinone oxidoreductase subunit J [Auraticoccus monumenti]|uniref:NADH-quinone oxidoreductase subunit J n=1 Tax=Auraticoccus monumenti TaxID=675864 RepID=A0A1G6WV21_9ACTN|nr:NADH-quinone oxidoreductase subunit J [Auraticoccus monumenti]SDD69664.1 NADH dehydrogenase subunit J [Auraticoccus monumenti]
MTVMVTSASVAFWLLAPLMVLAAIGMVLARKAVHSALCLAGVMVALAVQYAALDAPFLFAVQIIVYTGAILMLFLFVVMLVGVDSSDSFVETLRGQRVWAALVGAGLLVMLVVAVGHDVVTDGGTAPVGVAGANEQYGGNVQGLAALIFVRYVWAFEATSALLITAAVGAMVLTHRERLVAKRGQRERAVERMRAYADAGVHPGPLPTPGVFARHNSVDIPALLPDGSVAESSVSPTLRSRATIRTPEELLAPMATRHAEIAGDRDPQPQVGHRRDPRPGEPLHEHGLGNEQDVRDNTSVRDDSDEERI